MAVCYVADKMGATMDELMAGMLEAGFDTCDPDPSSGMRAFRDGANYLWFWEGDSLFSFQRTTGGGDVGRMLDALRDLLGGPVVSEHDDGYWQLVAPG
jgi:hypothetical protein